MRKILTVVLGVFVSILANPLALAADDHFLPNAPHLYERSARGEGVETRAKAWPTELELATTAITNEGMVSAFAQPAGRANLAVAQPVGAQNTTTGVAAANYQIGVTYYTREDYTATSQNLSFSTIYRFERLVYAHNSANLFGNLGSLTPGSVFTLTEGGVTRTYRVATQAVYDNTPNGLDGDYWLMENITYSALGHSVALMTCTGTPYGNGNSTQRLVVYGDEI